MVTTSIAILDAVAAVLFLYWIWGILPSLASVWRSILVGFIAFAVGTTWHAEGFWLLGELSIIGAGIVCFYLLIGELKQKDIALLRSTFAQRTDTNPENA